MKFILCQISDKLINPPTGTLAEQYYAALWDTKKDDGYWKPDDFWELPQWMAEVSHVIPQEYEQDLHVITDGLTDLPDANFYLFSALDVNKDIIERIARNNPDKRFIVGGCVEPLRGGNIAWCHSVRDLCEVFGWPYSYGTDYSLFKGTKCIPRLTLSTGCTHRCRFCTVPNELKELTQHSTRIQVNSFKGLKFKLVYVNDKTYGQASNYWYLRAMYYRIKRYNPEFEGFIVQTTAAKIAELPKTTWEDNHIKIVELGIETFNDNLLSRYRKPAREYDMARAILDLNYLDVKVIANIILGLPGETFDTYCRTLDFLYHSKLYALNIYTLAAYDSVDLGVEIKPGDKDELHNDRSFWTDDERRHYKLCSNEFYRLGIDIVRGYHEQR